MVPAYVTCLLEEEVRHQASHAPAEQAFEGSEESAPRGQNAALPRVEGCAVAIVNP